MLFLQMTDILENGWKEVNENTKNIVQDQVQILIIETTV